MTQVDQFILLIECTAFYPEDLSAMCAIAMVLFQLGCRKYVLQLMFLSFFLREISKLVQPTPQV